MSSPPAEELLEALRLQNQELQSARDALQRKLREMEIILEIEKLLGQNVPFEDLLQAVAESAREIVDARASSVIILDEEKHKLIFQEATGSVSDQIKQLYLPEGKGIAGFVIDTGEAVIANQPKDDPRFAGNISQSLGYEVTNLICIPMRREGKVIGALEVLNTERPGGFGEKDSIALTMLAQQAVKAIEEHRYREHRRQSRHLELVGRMVGVVLHDIRNPLSVVKGFNSLLLRNLRKGGRLTPQDQMDYLARSLESADRITNLCEDLLGYIRGNVELNKERVNLETVLDAVKDWMHQHTEGGSVAFEMHNEGPQQVLADQDKLTRALINLVRNAREALVKEGKVTLHVFKDGPDTVFTVQDTGPGIEENLLEEVMKPFITTKTSGAGLGLFITSTIARQHGGALQLKNLSPDGGLMATLRLPGGDP